MKDKANTKETAERKAQFNNCVIPGYGMATKAIHKLGDISRDEPDLCYLHGEDENNYIGAWVTGCGFVEVKFPKETTRPLTHEETTKWNKGAILHSNGIVEKLRV